MGVSAIVNFTRPGARRGSIRVILAGPDDLAMQAPL